MASLGPLIYIPFGARFKSQYITSVFFGEALSALLPHLLGIAQGILLPSECQGLDEVRTDNSFADERKPNRTQYSSGFANKHQLHSLNFLDGRSNE